MVRSCNQKQQSPQRISAGAARVVRFHEILLSSVLSPGGGPVTGIPGRHWCTLSCQHLLHNAPHAADHIVAVTWCCTRAAVSGLSQSECTRCIVLAAVHVGGCGAVTDAVCWHNRWWRQDRGFERPGIGHGNPSTLKAPTLTPKGGALGHGQALLTVFFRHRPPVSSIGSGRGQEKIRIPSESE